LLYGVKYLLEPKYHILKDFHLESGEVIPDLTMEYAVQGVKKLDPQGKITNAFLYLHGWSGDYTSVESLKSVIGPGKAIDTNLFYVISTTALGTPGSASPSSTNMGTDFPEYSIKDMAVAQYELLTQKLGVEHLRGIMGTSMGGFQALNWALKYPEFMDFLILQGTSHRFSNRMFGVYHLMNQIIEGDAEYNNGDYSQNPVKAMGHVAYLSYLWSLSPDNYEVCFHSKSEFLEGVGDRKADSVDWDANDLVWRNKALFNHDLTDKISEIDVTSLVIGIHQDQIVDEKFSLIPLHEGLRNSELFLFDSIWGHYGCVRDIDKVSGVIESFLADKK
jgi:homoserine O-acetyltransferase/O-succinyltransferase